MDQETPFGFDFSNIFHDLRMSTLVKRYPNFKKYPPSIQDAMEKCLELSMLCDNYIKKYGTA